MNKTVNVLSKEAQEIVNSKDIKFKYMMLDRLRSDCEYYLGYGNKNKEKLWTHDEQEQIDFMIALYNSFNDDIKPQYITLEQIEEYRKKMVQ